MKVSIFLFIIVLLSSFTFAVVEETATYRIECTPDVATIRYGGFHQFCSYQLKTGTYTGDVAFCFDTTINSAKVIYNKQTDITSLFKYKKYQMLKGDCYYIEDASWTAGEVKVLDIYYMPTDLSKSPKWDTYFGDVSTNTIDLKLDPIYNTSLYRIGVQDTDYYWSTKQSGVYNGYFGTSNYDLYGNNTDLNNTNAYVTRQFITTNNTFYYGSNSTTNTWHPAVSNGSCSSFPTNFYLMKNSSINHSIEWYRNQMTDIGYCDSTVHLTQRIKSLYSDGTSDYLDNTISGVSNNCHTDTIYFLHNISKIVNYTEVWVCTSDTTENRWGSTGNDSWYYGENRTITTANVTSNNISVPVLVNTFYLNGTNYTGNASINITFDGTTWTYITNLSNTSTIILTDDVNDNNRLQYKIYLNNNLTTIFNLSINYLGVINTINITIRDEVSGALILQNVTMTSYNFVTNTTNNITTATGYVNLANQSAGLTEYIFTVVNTSQGYGTRKIVYEVSNSSSGTFTIYLLNNQNYTIFTYFDKLTTAVLSNVRVEQQTFVNGSLVTVDSRLTDVTGLALFYYRPNVGYQFVSTKDDYATKTFSLNPVISSSYNVYITPTSASYDNPNRTQYWLTYDPFTKLLVIDYLQSNSLTDDIMLNVLLYNQTRTTTVCNSTSTNTSGALYCDLSGYSRTVHVVMYDDGNALFATYLDVGKANVGELLGQRESSVWAFFVYLTIVLAGILGGIVTAIVASILGLWIISALGILSAITTAAVILSAVVGIIILYLRK